MRISRVYLLDECALVIAIEVINFDIDAKRSLNLGISTSIHC
jgi:hypothetical protein